MTGDFDYISTYTRKQAIEDGTLVDLSSHGDAAELCKNAGFRVNVCMTARAFDRVWPIQDSASEREKWLRDNCQDIKGRLWDVLYLLALGCLGAGRGKSELEFQVILQQEDRGDWLECEAAPDWNRNARLTTFRSVISGGDEGEPVITIMLPDED